MNSKGINTALQAVLAVSLVVSIILFLQFFFQTRQARALQVQIVRYQQMRAAVNMLLADVNEYSKRNSAILPLLQSVAPAATNNPPAK
jgi:hypothetical protein